MVIDTSLNPTQVAGLLAFGASGLAAARAAHSADLQALSSASTWRWVSILQFLFCLEVWLGTRHVAHDLVNGVLQAAGMYQGRSAIQKGLLLGVGGSVFALAIWMWRANWLSRRHSHAELALACTVAVFLLFLVETISLHAIDRKLYRPTGPVLFIAYAWIANALAVLWLARPKLPEKTPMERS